MSEEMLNDMVKELYYGEAIKIVTENQGSLIEPLPEGIEMGIELMKEESVA